MLKFFAKISTLLATLFALLSPIAVVHWILQAFHLPPQLNGFMSFFHQVFEPANVLLDHAHHFPLLTFQGNAVPITQGLQALILTGMFFFFNWVTQCFRTMDKKIQATHENLVRKFQQKTHQGKEEIKTHQIITQRYPLVFLLYPTDGIGARGDLFRAYPETGGTMIRNTADTLLLKFESLENAVSYCAAAALKALEFHKTLRPIDPQYPFRFAIHAIEKGEENLAWGQEKCHTMTRFMGENQVFLTAEAKELMNALGLNTRFHCESHGFYDFPLDNVQEVFELVVQKKI